VYSGHFLDYNTRLAFVVRLSHSMKPVYKIVFHNQGKIYELYARHVSQGHMYAFVEVEDIIFGEHTELVVDPGEERLRDEFAGVKKTYVPVHAVIRIDEVSKQGSNKIVESSAGGNITPFPVTMPPKSDNN
jgi:hypothetical protein